MKDRYAISYKIKNKNINYFTGTIEEIDVFIRNTFKDEKDIDRVINWMYNTFLKLDKKSQMYYNTMLDLSIPFCWIKICNISNADFFVVTRRGYEPIIFKTFNEAIRYTIKNSLKSAIIYPQLFGEYIML